MSIRRQWSKKGYNNRQIINNPENHVVFEIQAKNWQYTYIFAALQPNDLYMYLPYMYKENTALIPRC